MTNGEWCRCAMRIAVGALWVLALGIAFAPAQARAGCGEGLVPLHLAKDVGQQAAGAFPHPFPLPRPTPVGPCSGPQCSRAPLVPSGPSVPASPRGSDQSGDLVSPAILSAPRSAPFDPQGPSFRAVRRPAGVFRPPRTPFSLSREQVRAFVP